MTVKLPSFNVQNDFGSVVLRDGLVLCFFMRRSHGEIAPEYLLEHRPARVQALALELAGELPFHFGCASLAFISPGGFHSPAMRYLRALCPRFPGLDAYHLMSPTPTGVYACLLSTFLGPTPNRARQGRPRSSPA